MDQVVEENVPPQVPEGKSHFSATRKALIEIGIFLILLILGGSVILFQNTKTPPQKTAVSSPAPTNETASWKIYTDVYDDGIFTVKYPTDWKAIRDDINKIIIFESPNYSGRSYNGVRISFNVSDTDKFTGKKTNDIEQWFSDYRSILKPGENEHIFEDTIKRTQVGGVLAIQYDSALQAYATETSFIKNDKLFKATFLWPNANISRNKKVMDDYKKIYDQIISTFKFIGSASTTPVASGNPSVGAGCRVGGCSGEICQNASDEPAVSTCIYNASYACYKSARCEKQSNGQCGWTKTTELTTCLDNNK